MGSVVVLSTNISYVDCRTRTYINRSNLSLCSYIFLTREMIMRMLLSYLRCFISESSCLLRFSYMATTSRFGGETRLFESEEDEAATAEPAWCVPDDGVTNRVISIRLPPPPLFSISSGRSCFVTTLAFWAAFNSSFKIFLLFSSSSTCVR